MNGADINNALINFYIIGAFIAILLAVLGILAKSKKQKEP